MFDYDPSDETIPPDIAATLDRLAAQKAAAEYARQAEREAEQKRRLNEFIQSCQPAVARIPDQFKPFLHYVRLSRPDAGDTHSMRMEIPGCWPFNFWATRDGFAWRGLDDQGAAYYAPGGADYCTVEEMALRAHEVYNTVEERKRTLRKNRMKAQEAAAAKAADPAPAPAPAVDWQVQITDGLRENPGDPVWLSLRATLSIVQRLESIESALIDNRG